MLGNARIAAGFWRGFARCGYIHPFYFPKSTLLPPARTNFVWAPLVSATVVSTRESNDSPPDSAQATTSRSKLTITNRAVGFCQNSALQSKTDRLEYIVGLCI